MSKQPESSSLQPQLSEAQIAAAEFFKGERHYYYQPLYNAAKRGDWETAKNFIDGDPNASTARITVNAGTVAAISCQWGFILKLLELLSSPESIAVQDCIGNTVLHYVADGGSLETVEALIQKNPDLPNLINDVGNPPLVYSCYGKNRKLVSYLSPMTIPESSDARFRAPSLATILRDLITSGHLDTALYFVGKYPPSALDTDESGRSMLFYLADHPSYFFNGSNLGFFERCINKFLHTEGSPALVTSLQQGSSVTQVFRQFKGLIWKAIIQPVAASSIEKVQNAKFTHECAVNLVHCVCEQLSSKSFQQIIEFLHNERQQILLLATAEGIEEIVETLFHHFPDLIYLRPEKNLLQAAIEYRQEKIVNIIKRASLLVAKDLSAKPLKGENTTLHLAGKLAPDLKLFSVSGAAFQMQRELQWFKEVEKISHPHYKTLKNEDNQTAIDVFRKEHKRLAEQGEKWMKDSANSCMLVTTLVATILFAAAFTVPGGNVQDKGIPIFLQANAFTIFAISNALGLFSSLTSLLMFLAILTARYELDDFLESLPKKLIIGLDTLFFAIATMIIAFGAALTIVLSERWQWVSVPITILASCPVAIFIMLQLPLFIQMVRSTYGSGMFHP